MAQARVFDSASAAFDKCRELDRPMLVDVPNEKGGREIIKIFPSGDFVPAGDRSAKETAPGSAPRPWSIKKEFSCHVTVVDSNGKEVFRTYCDYSNNGMADVALILALVNGAA